MLQRLPISAFTMSNNSDAVSEIIVVTGTIQQSGLPL